jgi:hypothetical protein
MAYVEVHMPGKDLSERSKEERRTSWSAWFFCARCGYFGLYGSRGEQRSEKGVWGKKGCKTVGIEMIAGVDDGEMKNMWQKSPHGGDKWHVEREEEGVHRQENKQSTKSRTRRYIKARSKKKGTKNKFALGAELQDDNDLSAKPKIPYWR